MSIGVQFKTDTHKLAAKLRAMRVAASNTTTGPVRQGFDNAASRYENFVYRRFARFSQHGGDWAELSPVTIEKRRAEGHQGSRILFVLGRLLAAMRIGSALVMLRIAKGFRITFSNTKYGRIARWQHGGTATIPARPILVPADARTLSGMRKDVGDGYRQALREAKERAR
jgi:hypothetical protein